MHSLQVLYQSLSVYNCISSYFAYIYAYSRNTLEVYIWVGVIHVEILCSEIHPQYPVSSNTWVLQLIRRHAGPTNMEDKQTVCPLQIELGVCWETGYLKHNTWRHYTPY